jgi:hypothetical protein
VEDLAMDAAMISHFLSLQCGRPRLLREGLQIAEANSPTQILGRQIDRKDSEGAVIKRENRSSKISRVL